MITAMVVSLGVMTIDSDVGGSMFWGGEGPHVHDVQPQLETGGNEGWG
jgi:hypothetical protein